MGFREVPVSQAPILKPLPLLIKNYKLSHHPLNPKRLSSLTNHN